MRGLALVFWKKHGKSMDACRYLFVSLCKGVDDERKEAGRLGELSYLVRRYSARNLVLAPRHMQQFDASF